MKSTFLAMGVVSGKIEDIPKFIEVKVGEKTYKFPLVVYEYGDGTNATEDDTIDQIENTMGSILYANDVPDKKMRHV